MSRSKYTKAERNVAALICAIAASRLDRSVAYYDTIADEVGADYAALFLAQDAWSEAHKDRNAAEWQWPPEIDAEAEALLRTGFEPEHGP